MVDDDDVGGERLLARVHHETLAVVGALAAEAVLARRGDLRPDAGVVGHVRQLGLVAGRRRAREGFDPLEIAGIGTRGECSLLPGALEMIVANVIRPAFEQRDGERDFERITDQRQVALEKLILKRLGTRRYDDLAAREQGGDEIRKGLAGASTCFGEQLPALVDRARDRVRHRELLLAKAISGKLARERPLRTEDAREVRDHLGVRRDARIAHDGPRHRARHGAVFLRLDAGAATGLAAASCRARIALIRSVNSPYGRTTRCL